jgi:YHS domain-containing protein
MSSPEELKTKIDKLLKEADKERDKRQMEMHRELIEINQSTKGFEALADEWLDTFILSKLKTLAEMFSNSEEPTRFETSHSASVTFHPTEKFPTDCRVSVNISHDPGTQDIHITFQVSIIPILIDYEREAKLKLTLEKPDTEKLKKFIDERILRFVKDYLKIQEPDSPYQKYYRVTDPVCGINFSRADAGSSFEYDYKKYYFCSEECRRKFESNPEFHLKR